MVLSMTSPSVPGLSRRAMLQGSLCAVGAAACSSAASMARVVGANETVRLGVIGLNGRGAELTRSFALLPNVRIAALCDVDRDVLDRRATELQPQTDGCARLADPRALLDAREVDAIVVATPNHWHALLGVWACERGKHAYVEKPISHDVWEGAQLVQAAARTRCIVAVGTQCRSHRGIQEAIAFAQSGALGRIRLARGLCYKPRGSIGKVDGPQAPPASVDYDLWLGPATEQPVLRRRFHYDWHWQWDFGNGDFGNQGVHQMDLCRWAVGLDRLPTRVWSVGGRVGYEDDGQTPNTQVTWIEGGLAPILFEVRGLPRARGEQAMDQFLSASIGVVIHCEQGCVVLSSYTGGQAFDLEGRPLSKFDGGGDHCRNFVEAVRDGDPRRLAADAQTGHWSAAACHLGMESLRQGRPASLAECAAGVAAIPELSEAVLRMQAHLAGNAIADLSPLRLGALLAPDPDANRHPRRQYRDGFVLAEQAPA